MMKAAVIATTFVAYSNAFVSGQAVASIVCRFEDSSGEVLLGQPIEHDDQGFPITARLLEDQDLFGGLQLSDKHSHVAKLLAPLVPREIMLIGLNYLSHLVGTNSSLQGLTRPFAKQFLKSPTVFYGSVSSLNDPGQPVQFPSESMWRDYEGELAVVIGKTCKDVSIEDALDCVVGYTVSHDISDRYWQLLGGGGGQWGLGKSFDTFKPLGPVLATRTAIPDPQKLQLTTRVNGKIVQNNNTATDMLWSVAELIQFASEGTTLWPGTVISTGTPGGTNAERLSRDGFPNIETHSIQEIGEYAAKHGPEIAEKYPWLKDGDVVTVEIDGIGKLTNPIQVIPSTSYVVV